MRERPRLTTLRRQFDMIPSWEQGSQSVNTRLAPLVLASGLGLAASVQAEEWTEIRIATEGAYPPWNYTDSSGNLVGFEIDLAGDLCARMGVECEIVAQDWEGIIPALEAGKYDAIIAGMSITDDRKQVISFSDSYAATPSHFAVLKDNELAGFGPTIERIDLTEVDDAEQAAIDAIVATFEGKTVGVQVATTHANFLDQYLADSVDVRKYDTQENLDLDLQTGRVDAALAAMSYWQPLLDTEKGEHFTLIGPDMVGGPFGEGVGVGIRQEDEALVELFNQAIAEAKADGTLADLALKHFGFDASS